MIVGAILVVIILYFFVKEGGKSVGNDGRKLGHYDYLIVGSGLYGATFNYFAKRSGKTTYIVEKRDVVGGNLYCEKLKEFSFINMVLKFSIDNKKVLDFVNNLTYFNLYIQQTIARYGDKLYSLPFNMWTFNQLWGVITPKKAKSKIDSDKYTGEVHNLEEKAQSLVGKELYEKLIKGYTEKQIGRD